MLRLIALWGAVVRPVCFSFVVARLWGAWGCRVLWGVGLVRFPRGVAFRSAFSLGWREALGRLARGRVPHPYLKGEAILGVLPHHSLSKKRFREPARSGGGWGKGECDLLFGVRVGRER